METIYNAASSASKALFGEQNPQQNRKPNAATTDDTDRPHETNPFRQTPETDNNPFRHTADTSAASKPHSTDSGFGSQHTAGSGFELNKPSDAVGSLEKSNARSYDNPTSGDFDKPSTAGTYGEHASSYDHSPTDKPFTTTSTYEKHSIGDLNKDGSRHETSDVENPATSALGHSDSSPTISSIHDSSSTGGNLPELQDHHTGAGSMNKPSTTSYGEHSHTKDPTDFDKPATHSISTYSPSHGVSTLASGVGAPHEHKSASDPTTSTHQQHPHQDIKPLIDSSTPSNPVSSSTTDPSPLTGTTGTGPHAAVEPSVSADPTHAQKTTPKQQGADRPMEEPSRGGAPKHTLHDKKKSTESEGGTGEKYEKSTGVAAEGGDFDASRPGAGREAEYAFPFSLCCM